MLSVILTCHNEARYIGEAVRSVAAQTRIDQIAEIIVVNDGSTDNSADVLAALAVEIPLLRTIEQSGIGLPAARNCAMQQAKGDLIAFLDGDDYWLPQKLERQLPSLARPEVGLSYTDYVDFAAPDGSDAQFISVGRFSADNERTLEDYFVHDGPIMPSGVIVRRAAFDDVGVFDAAMRIGEDQEMFLRIAERWRFQHVPGGLVCKRRHPNQITRRLESLLPVMMLITERFSRRNPQLVPLVHKRMARRYGRVGNDCAQHGEVRLALRYLLKAIANDPLFWRPYVYLLLAFVPKGLATRVRRGLRHVFHRSRSAQAQKI